MLGMKLLTLALVLACLCSLLTPVNASDVEHSKGWSGLDGNDLLPECQISVEQLNGKSFPQSQTTEGLHCLAYLEGFLDGFSFRDVTADKPSRMLCYPEGVSTAQMLRVVTKWLQGHPERLHEPAFGLVFTAIHEAFACSASNPPPH